MSSHPDFSETINMKTLIIEPYDDRFRVKLDTRHESWGGVYVQEIHKVEVYVFDRWLDVTKQLADDEDFVGFVDGEIMFTGIEK